MSEYKCLKCGAEFDEPKEVCEEYYYGHTLMSSACPYCRGDYEEAEECKGCGETFCASDLTDGFCINCEARIQGRLLTLIDEFNEDEKNYIYENLGDIL